MRHVLPPVLRSPRVSLRSCCHGPTVAALAAGTLLAPAVADAATKTATSAATGMTATLDGAQLTVSTGPRVSSTYMGLVQGHTVTVACLSGAADLVQILDEESLAPSGPFDFGFLGGPALWPAGSETLTFTLPRDVSDRADACLVGRNLELAASFGFSELAAELLDEGLPFQRMLLAHRAAKLAARAREDRRFPPARALARRIAAAEPQMRVDFARTVRRARGNDRVYVIGAGTNFKRLQLAYRQNDGQPILLEGGRRGIPEIQEPDGDVQVPETEGDESRTRRGR